MATFRRGEVCTDLRFAALVAALVLAGCGGQTGSAVVGSDSPASSATSAAESSTPSSQVPASPAAAPAAGEKPPREFVVGKWGTDGDCELAIDLRADGTSDGPFGNWAYSDGVISFPEEPDFKVNVTVVDDNTMESTNATSDKTSKMTRCP